MEMYNRNKRTIKIVISVLLIIFFYFMYLFIQNAYNNYIYLYSDDVKAYEAIGSQISEHAQFIEDEIIKLNKTEYNFSDTQMFIEHISKECDKLNNTVLYKKVYFKDECYQR